MALELDRQKHYELDKASNEDKDYIRRFRYKTAPRSNIAIEDTGLDELGHTLESIKDAALFMRHLVVEPKLNPDTDHVYKYPDQTDAPLCIDWIASGLLSAPTVNRADIRADFQRKKHPDLVAFFDKVHQLMRQMTKHIGATFVVPEGLEGLILQYDAKIKEYKNLLDEAEKRTGERHPKHIDPEVLKAYGQELEKLRHELYGELEKAPTVPVTVGGTLYTLPNKEPLNDRLKHTYPAAFLHTCRHLGGGAADATKRPAAYEYEGQRDLIGAQSMITFTMHKLRELAASQGVNLPDIDHVEVKKLVHSFKRSFQLALAFCRVADCGYDMMFKDLERYARSGEDEAELGPLKSPQEAALMLYAVDRRFARDDLGDALFHHTLRDFSNVMHTCSTPQDMKIRFVSSNGFKSALDRCHQIAKENNIENVLQVLDQLQTLMVTG